MPEFILFQKFYDFTIGLYLVIKNIPKSHRLVTGAALEKACLTILLNIKNANKSTGDMRKATQDVISRDLDSLQILLRLCKDLRFISVGQYVYQITKLNEVAKIFQGWVKA